MSRVQWGSVMQAEDLPGEDSQREGVLRHRDVGGLQDRLTLRPADACRLLSISVDSFKRYVAPEVKCIRVGRVKLFPRTGLERWVEENSVCIGEDW